MGTRFEAGPGLLNRERERAALDELLDDLRAGRGRSLVVRGEAGVGKSALLEYVTEAAADMRVARAAGVESEMELAFAGLHLLCVPLLERLESLPGPQRDALAVAFGLREGGVPDRFMVALAVLTLLSDAAEEKPLLCVIDDAQWLDQASAQALAFAARRLLAEPVGLLFAARDPGEQFRGLADLEVPGLPEREARALLRSVVRFRIDEPVQERILAETNGNPLALLELPRGLGPAQLAGGFGLVGAQAVPARIEQGFRRRLAELPADTRTLMLVAAAEPAGDAALVWRAAERLGVPPSAAEAAHGDGLLRIETLVRFRHPLVRSAVYSAAAPPERRAVHRALAEVTDHEHDRDRRAWHLAAAAAGPDEEVAAELERSAGRAQARGGMASAAAFLQRSVELTAEPAARATRALAAARANLQAGAFGAATELLAVASAAPLDEFQQALAALLRGQMALASNVGGDASVLLVKAAERLEPLDAPLARDTYVDAWYAAMYAGEFADEADLHEVSRKARSAPPAVDPPRPSDLLLNGVTALITEGRAKAAPLLKQTVRVFAQEDLSPADRQRWSPMAAVVAPMVWDEDGWLTIMARELQASREAGMLVQLVIWVNANTSLAVWRGDFAAAAALVAEGRALAAATGINLVDYGALSLTGYRGVADEAVPLIEAVIEEARAGGQGTGVQYARWTSAILHNGLGRYEKALADARAAAQEPELHLSVWALPELIEAACRTGRTRSAREALDRLAAATGIAETDWARGTYARSAALLSEGDDADDRYREAIDRLGRTSFRTELARAHLLYGEWLRREGRRGEARTQLGSAHDMSTTIGMRAFAERARRELAATGESVRGRTAGAPVRLTPQEAQIARLAREGLSNPEIAAQLFLSPRTIEYHLGKVFTKLDITSRHQLRQALGDGAGSGLTA
ncbi:helix-turn-helix transcriptional regulator [Actinomadura geliboluensis]|uniref:Helix-turn-helix transcriptional regulator n=1 Tax=Actinomadura geliboluensis TaxID=882440 RepID=A0A5S4GIA2_9ACTN|nr:helix-turn-helix transcriptional regulator [Actinomadura geliboluensis]TMR32432.1 helix-turn-helix transcriptional regulator [Actinomadura geliboluensis]